MVDDFMKDYDFKTDVEKQFPKVWANLFAEKNITPQQNPVSVILGGQPGAGKSFGSEKISNNLNGNVLIINGDEFRAYHSHFEKIGDIYGKDLANKTQDFSNAMVNRVKNEAVNNRFNVIIEGTFRTIQTPLNELNNLKKIGYRTGVVICTCPKKVSWESTIKRGDEQKEKGLPPRYVSKESHDSTVNNLSSNVEYVYQSGKPDFLEVYSRSEKLFDSKTDSTDKLKPCIENELNKA